MVNTARPFRRGGAGGLLTAKRRPAGQRNFRGWRRTKGSGWRCLLPHEAAMKAVIRTAESDWLVGISAWCR